MNSEETVLKYLAKQDGEVTREDIQLATGYANGSLKNALARLTGNGLAIQSKGTYRITPLGKERQNDPTSFSASFMNSKPKKVVPLANVVEQLMDWDEIQTNEMVRGMLSLDVRGLEYLVTPMAPLIVFYMKLVGIEFPDVTRAAVANSTDDALYEIFQTFLNDMRNVLDGN